MGLARQTIEHAYRRVAPRLLGDDVARPDGASRLAPEWLVLDVNNVCNLHCTMCDVGLEDRTTAFWSNLIGSDPRDMTLELLERVLEQARAFFPRPRIALAMTEPLIHPRILDLARAVTSRGFYCAITSNGSRLPRLAAGLVEAGLGELTLSVDGPPEVHDRIRGRKGSFDELYQGALALAAAGGDGRGPRLQISFTVSQANQGHIAEAVLSVLPLRPERVMVSQLNFISDEMVRAHNGAYGGPLAVTRSSLGEMDPAGFDADLIWSELQRVREEARRFPGTRVTLTPDFGDASEVARYYREPERFVGTRTCRDPWRMAMVRSDGTLLPAHGRCYHVPLGNVLHASLAELWNGPAMRGFRRTLQVGGGTLPACARCCGVIGRREP
jgi:MoaA/NifB/PqqE/SkfB family radical SAM enzyme